MVPDRVSVNLNISKTLGFGPAPASSAGPCGPAGPGRRGPMRGLVLNLNHRYNLTFNVMADGGDLDIIRNIINHTNRGNFNGILTSYSAALAAT